jgi:hypothetical protein
MFHVLIMSHMQGVQLHQACLRLLRRGRSLVMLSLRYAGSSGFMIGLLVAFAMYIGSSGRHTPQQNTKLKASFTGVSCGGAGDCDDLATCTTCGCELNGLNSECTDVCWNYCPPGTTCDGQGGCPANSSTSSISQPISSSSSSGGGCCVNGTCS